MKQDVQVLLVAAGAIGLLVVSITRWKLNAFIALALAALAVGLGCAMPLAEIAVSFQTGLGATLGSTAAIIALGAMLGKLLTVSGGAESLAERFRMTFGSERAPYCLLALGFVVGLCAWFTVGLLLLVPVLFSFVREGRKTFVALALPLLASLSVMHGLTPPHPGPVAAAGLLGARMAGVLAWGLAIGLPTALVAGPLLARWLPSVVPRSDAVAPPDQPALSGTRAAGVFATLSAIGLPVILILGAGVAELSLPRDNNARAALMFVGHPTVALIVGVLFASWSLGTACGHRGHALLKFSEEAVASVGMVLLIVGGGGGFARVLLDSGAADALGRLAQAAHLSPLLYGWLAAAVVRVATGSATVAITTAAGLLAPLVAQHPHVNRELLVVALGCGSLVLSHLNDGGFWVVKESLGLTVEQTLRTWTVMETVIGVVGLMIALGCSWLT